MYEWYDTSEHDPTIWGDAAASSGFGFSRALIEEEDVELPTDDQGNILTREEIDAALEQLWDSRLNIDHDVRRLEDPEQQADTAADLVEHYNKLEKKYKKFRDDIDKYEREMLARVGARPYGMETEDGNLAVTDVMDDIVDWYEHEHAMLKERMAAKIRGRIKKLRVEGHTVNDKTRDKMYETLVTEEVIEAWEPLEF
jgi:hypothetical protein